MAGLLISSPNSAQCSSHTHPSVCGFQLWPFRKTYPLLSSSSSECTGKSSNGTDPYSSCIETPPPTPSWSSLRHLCVVLNARAIHLAKYMYTNTYMYMYLYVCVGRVEVLHVSPPSPLTDCSRHCFCSYVHNCLHTATSKVPLASHVHIMCVWEDNSHRSRTTHSY